MDCGKDNKAHDSPVLQSHQVDIKRNHEDGSGKVRPKRRKVSSHGSKERNESWQGEVHVQSSDLSTSEKTDASLSNVCKSNLPGPPFNFLDSKYLIKTLECASNFNRILPCVPDGLKENQYFLVDNSGNARRYRMGIKGDYKDDSGPWNFSNSHTVTRHFLRDSKTSVHLMDRLYCTETKRNKKRIYIPLTPQPLPSNVVSLHCHYVKHKSSDMYKRRVSWIDNLSQDTASVACFEYCGLAPHCLREVLKVCSTEVYDDIYCARLEEDICPPEVNCLSVVISEYPHLTEAVGGYRLPDTSGNSLDLGALVNTLENVVIDSKNVMGQVPNGLKENLYFVMDTKVINYSPDFVRNSIFTDDCGPWDTENSVYEKSYYIKQLNKFECIKLKDGFYFIAQSDGECGLLVPQPELDAIISVHKYDVCHSYSIQYKKKVTLIENMGKDIPSVAFLEYLGTAPEKLKQEMNNKLSITQKEEDTQHSSSDPSLISCQGKLSAVVFPSDALDGERLEVDTCSSFLPTYILIENLRKEASSTRLLPHVPRGLKVNQHFIVNNSINVERHRRGRKCTFWDDSGPWTNHVSVTATYLYEKKKLKRVLNQGGGYCTEHKVDGDKIYIPLVPQPDPDDIVVFHRSSARHKESNSYRRRITWVEDGSEDLPHVACYEYCGLPPDHLKLSLNNKSIRSTEVNLVSQGDYSLHRWHRCPNGGFMLTHPGGKFLDLYEVISVLQMVGINDNPLETVPTGVKENQFFLVSNKSNLEKQKLGQKNVFWDDCGAWDSNLTKVNTERYLCGPNQKLTRVVELQGELCIERYKDRSRIYIPLSPQPDPSTVFIIHRNYSKHSLSKCYQRKITWIEVSGRDFPKVACYEYLGEFPGRQPHGSCRKTFKNYIRSNRTHGVQEMIQKSGDQDWAVGVGDDIASPSHHFETVEQVNDFGNEDKVKSRYSSAEIKNSNTDQALSILSMIDMHPFVQRVTFSKDMQVSVIMYTEEQLLDIRRFCCYSDLNETTILGFSNLQDICGCTLTFTMFKNLSVLRRNTKQNPIFPGPMFLHEKSSHLSYLSFFSQLSERLGEASQLIVVLEGEEMQKAFNQAFPNSSSLSSIHSMQKDLLNHLKERGDIQIKKRNMIKDLVFGDNGIVHVKDSSAFSHLLNKAQKLCDEVAPDVGMYFKLHTIPQLKRNFNVMQKHDLPISVLKWTSSNCNIFKHSLKVQMKISAQSTQVDHLIEDLCAFVDFQYMELRRCLYKHGEFTLCQEFHKFLRSSVLWHEMEENDKNQHFLSFLCEGRRKKENSSGHICSQLVQSEILKFIDED